MLNLDFNLTDIKERIDLITDLLESDKKFTSRELEVMGEYLLFLYDKETIKKESRKESHKRVLKDKVNGRKTYVTTRKSKIQSIYNENKQEVINKNKDYFLLLENNLNNLREFKEIIKDKNYSYFSKRNVSKSKILGDINKDIRDLENAKILFEANNHGGEFARHDRINLDYVDYTNEKFIYEVLKNIDYLKLQAPPSNCFFIYIDFDNATKNIKFTKKQEEVLYKLRNGESIEKNGQTIRNILKKYSKYFEKK